MSPVSNPLPVIAGGYPVKTYIMKKVITVTSVKAASFNGSNFFITTDEHQAWIPEADYNNMVKTNSMKIEIEQRSEYTDKAGVVQKCKNPNQWRFLGMALTSLDEKYAMLAKYGLNVAI